MIDQRGASHARRLGDELIGRAIVAMPGEAVEGGLDNRGFAALVMGWWSRHLNASRYLSVS